MGNTTHVSQSDVTAQPVNVFIDGFYANGVDARIGPVLGLTGDVYQVKVTPTVSVRVDSGGGSSQGAISLSVN